MPFIQWCYERRPKSKVAKEISGRGRRRSREKGNELVGDFRFIKILKLFILFYFILITLLYLFFPHFFYPRSLPTPMHSTHYPRHLATLSLTSLYVVVFMSELHSPLFTVHKTKHMSQNKVARVVTLENVDWGSLSEIDEEVVLLIFSGLLRNLLYWNHRKLDVAYNRGMVSAVVFRSSKWNRAKWWQDSRDGNYIFFQYWNNLFNIKRLFQAFRIRSRVCIPRQGRGMWLCTPCPLDRIKKASQWIYALDWYVLDGFPLSPNFYLRGKFLHVNKIKAMYMYGRGGGG